MALTPMGFAPTAVTHRANQTEGRTLSAPPPLPAPAAEPADSFNRTESGVSFKWTKQALEGQEAWALSATLPAAPLIGAPIVIEMVRLANGEAVSATARIADSEQTFQTHLQKDGKLYVDLGGEEPFLYFDSKDQTYGLSARAKQDATGAVTRDRQQYHHPDGSQTMIFNETARPGVKTYTKVVARNGQFEACQVEDQGGQPQQTGRKATTKEMWLGQKFEKTGWKETALNATLLPDGRIQVTDDASYEARARAAERSGTPNQYAAMHGGFLWAMGKVSAAEPQVFTPLSTERVRPAPRDDVPPFLAPTGI